MRIAFYTLGCKVNQYDTQMMMELLENAGHMCVPFQEIADCYIINTCTVTSMSDKKSRQIISRCKKNNPGAIIVVCGCYSQISPDETASIPGVDIVLGTANRKNIVTYLEQISKDGAQIKDIPDLKTQKILSGEQISRFDEKTRAILKIEDGCQNFCSYCAIPFARGQIRSKTIESIQSELAALRSNGYNEVVLTGIHLASYGKDLKNVDLADAIRAASTLGFSRIRLGSLEPNIITPSFLDRICDIKTLMPSFHLSLQSGCDSVLRRMNRHYTTSEYKHAVTLLRRYYPECAITTDIIVGFPGETDEEFCQTMDFATEISFAKIHIFPFSPRRKTKAATMPDQISKEIKNSRCKQLEEIERHGRLAFMRKQIGRKMSVLLEKKTNGCWEGYTENYLPVLLKSDEENMEGVILDVLIENTNSSTLFAANN